MLRIGDFWSSLCESAESIVFDCGLGGGGAGQLQGDDGDEGQHAEGQEQLGGLLIAVDARKEKPSGRATSGRRLGWISRKQFGREGRLYRRAIR